MKFNTHENVLNEKIISLCICAQIAYSKCIYIQKFNKGTRV